MLHLSFKKTDDKERRKMILSGNLWRTILMIIFPLAIYQLFNSFYTLFDQVICEEDALLLCQRGGTECRGGAGTAGRIEKMKD